MNDITHSEETESDPKASGKLSQRKADIVRSVRVRSQKHADSYCIHPSRRPYVSVSQSVAVKVYRVVQNRTEITTGLIIALPSEIPNRRWPKDLCVATTSRSQPTYELGDFCASLARSWGPADVQSQYLKTH